MPPESQAPLDPAAIRCVVFDYAWTLSSSRYFTISPPGCSNWRELIQSRIFDRQEVIRAWMRGTLTLPDAAAMLAPEVGMDVEPLIELMEDGCCDLQFNQAVWDLAAAQKATGRKTALVTGNMDVFTTVVVPSHGLADIFDVILNTADYGELRKEVLWPIAFRALGGDIHYHNSMLIEDGEENPGKFTARGGVAHQYSTDEALIDWLDAAGWR